MVCTATPHICSRACPELKHSPMLTLQYTHTHTRPAHNTHTHTMQHTRSHSQARVQADSIHWPWTIHPHHKSPACPRPAIMSAPSWALLLLHTRSAHTPQTQKVSCMQPITLLLQAHIAIHTLQWYTSQAHAEAPQNLAWSCKTRVIGGAHPSLACQVRTQRACRRQYTQHTPWRQNWKMCGSSQGPGCRGKEQPGTTPVG